ncbi:hypothetical protein KR018_005061, partial [Drosophila ironensis]
GGGGGLKNKLAEKIKEELDYFLGIKCLHGNTQIGTIKVNNVLGGMRGLSLLVCLTSSLHPEEGIFYRGKTIKEVCKKLPRVLKGTKEGTPEGAFYFLTLGSMPSKNDAKAITKEWLGRGNVPRYCLRMIDAMDKRVHPMAQLVAASSCLNTNSKFVAAYRKGAKRADYWKHVYEDSMNLCAMLPTVASVIYCNVFKDGAGTRELNKKTDWSGNFCRMLGLPDKAFMDLMRMYMVIHADHESGNVSAHASHLVGSALSDPYLCYAASMCGLAGPLHGLANQEVLIWLTKMRKAIGDDPKDEEIVKFINDTLKGGQVVPGYGHAVLRKTDPRFIVQNEFAMRNCKDDPGVKLVTRLWKIVPEVLGKLGKVANPFPNVDAHSGVLLQHYCLTQMNYYTVLFGVSRAIGVMAQLIWSRALAYPIERPKSISASELCGFIRKAESKKKKKC